MGADMTRDARRYMAIEAYLVCLLDALKTDDDKTFDLLEKAAKASDAIGPGYFNQPTGLSYGLKPRLARLREGDREEWRELLRAVDTDFPKLIKRFEKAAPRGLAW